jgi:hypothetical protein
MSIASTVDSYMMECTGTEVPVNQSGLDCVADGSPGFRVTVTAQLDTSAMGFAVAQI